MNFDGFKQFLGVQRVIKKPEKFNRKAGYGERHKMIESLRRTGWQRRLAIKGIDSSPYPNKFYKIESTAMYAFHFIDKAGKTFLDLGCGYSPDSQIALMQGCEKAYRLDLYKTPLWKDGTELLIADYCEKIPLKAKSVDFALAQATLNLNSKSDRAKAYVNVRRVLKPGGYFAFYMCSLVNEWDWDIRSEIARAERAGLVLEGKFPGGAIMRRPSRQPKKERNT